MAGKGQPFERKIAYALSEWWSGGERSDLFWRSHTSGGRATVRGRKGLTTHGQHGDIAATDPSGEPLLKAFTFECKCGYSKTGRKDKDIDLLSYYDALKPETGCVLRDWAEQARAAQKASGSVAFVIVFHRDRRKTMALFSSEAYRLMPVEQRDLGANLIRLELETASRHELLTLVTFDRFCKLFDPFRIKKYIGSKR